MAKERRYTMAKRERELVARVRYVNYGKPTGPKGQKEAFNIEIKTEDGWGLETGYFLINSEEYPDIDLVSSNIVPHIFRLMRLGYKVVFCKAGEE